MDEVDFVCQLSRVIDRHKTCMLTLTLTVSNRLQDIKRLILVQPFKHHYILTEIFSLSINSISLCPEKKKTTCFTL